MPLESRPRGMEEGPVSVGSFQVSLSTTLPRLTVFGFVVVVVVVVVAFESSLSMRSATDDSDDMVADAMSSRVLLVLGVLVGGTMNES